MISVRVFLEKIYIYIIYFLNGIEKDMPHSIFSSRAKHTQAVRYSVYIHIIVSKGIQDRKI